MARKKVKLAWIADDASRRATLKKRRKGLVTKAAELSTLCDVNLCLIVYSPGETLPEVWPSPVDVARVLDRLQQLPEMEQSRKMLNQEGFMHHRICKMQDKLRKQDRENRELETMLLMHQLLKGRSLNSVEVKSLPALAWFIEVKLKEVKRRLEFLASEKHENEAQIMAGELPQMGDVKAPATTEELPLLQPEVKEGKFEASMDELQKQNWFNEILIPHEEIIADSFITC